MYRYFLRTALAGRNAFWTDMYARKGGLEFFQRRLRVGRRAQIVVHVGL